MAYYGTAQAFIDYHESRGREIPATWTEDGNAVILSSLLVASDWVDAVYGASFVGYKAGGFPQEQQWPRKEAYVYSSYPEYLIPDDVIPVQVENAVYEAAFRQATIPGCLDVDYKPGKYKSVSVSGAIAVEYMQFSSAQDLQLQIGAVDKILWPILSQSGSAAFSGASGGSSRV